MVTPEYPDLSVELTFNCPGCGGYTNLVSAVGHRNFRVVIDPLLQTKIQPVSCPLCGVPLFEIRENFWTAQLERKRQR
jgi:hypothetical protein